MWFVFFNEANVLWLVAFRRSSFHFFAPPKHTLCWQQNITQAPPLRSTWSSRGSEQQNKIPRQSAGGRVCATTGQEEEEARGWAVVNNLRWQRPRFWHGRQSIRRLSKGGRLSGQALFPFETRYNRGVSLLFLFSVTPQQLKARPLRRADSVWM